MGAPIRIQYFDGFRLIAPERTVSRFRTRVTAELLGVLAMHPGRTYHREELTELLWPDVDPVVGRNRLRYTLTCLRRLVEPIGAPRGSVLNCGRLEVLLDPDVVTTDVDAFEQALAVARGTSDPNSQFAALKSAVSLYGGDFMSGFYSDWVERQRAILADSFTTAACQLAEIALGLGEVEAALEAARRAVQVDRSCEAAYQRLISAHLAAGNRAGAMQCFRELKAVLYEELGVEPAPETRALMGHAGVELPITPRVSKPTARPRVPETRDRAQRTPLTGPKYWAAVTPSSFTRFIGREDECARILALLRTRSQRVLTLTGPGGIGKTRLAAEVFRRLASSEGPRTLYVDLVDCREPQRILDSLVRALGLRSDLSVQPLDQIASCLDGYPAVALFDNFEHLVGPGRTVLGELLQRNTSLDLVVTSRIPLDLSGECVFPVSPLPVPGIDASPESSAREASVQLFVDRARFVRSDFTVTVRNAEQVSEICRRLDGVPLAIELAAGWAGTMSLLEIAERLLQPLEFLACHREDVLPRHQTIRKCLEQSFELLPPSLQTFFPKLAVFRGGWTMEAASAVTASERVSDHIDSLRRTSFLMPYDSGHETRYRLLEVVREFAAERLTSSDLPELQSRHAAFYRDLSIEARKGFNGVDSGRFLETLKADEPNFEAAAEHCLSGNGDPETGVWLAEALWSLWQRKGYRPDQCQRLASMLHGAPGASAAVRARSQECVAAMSTAQGRYAEAYAHLEGAVALLRVGRNSQRLGYDLCHLGRLALHIGDAVEFERLHEESLAILRDLAHRPGIAMALCSLGKGLTRLGRHADARSHLLESVATFQDLGDEAGCSATLSWLADAHFCAGDQLMAEAIGLESLDRLRSLSDARNTAHAAVVLARILAYTQDAQSALKLAEEGDDLCCSLGDLWGTAAARHYRGVLMAQSNAANGLTLLGQALDLRVRLGDQGEVAESLEAVASVCLRGASAEHSLRLLACAAVMRKNVQMPVIEPEAARLTSLHERALQLLGEDRCRDAVRLGSEMALEEVAACAHILVRRGPGMATP